MADSTSGCGWLLAGDARYLALLQLSAAAPGQAAVEMEGGGFGIMPIAVRIC
jgi:hypothetical protein